MDILVEGVKTFLGRRKKCDGMSPSGRKVWLGKEIESAK
jgi:hypothetical protein